MKTSINYLAVVIVAVLIDAASKYLALEHLQVHMNPGIFLGSFTSAPLLFRVVGLSVFSGFLLLAYFMALYLLPPRLVKLRYALSCVLGGVLGNVCDRLIRGATIDFIPFKALGASFAFNIADVFLFFGVALFLYLIFREEKSIWFENNNRNRILVKPKEQLRLAFKFMFFSWITSVTIGLFVWAYLRSYFSGHSSYTADFLAFYAAIALLLCAIIFMFGIIISHRSAGPLIAFELYVEKLLAGQDEEFSLREGDNYKHLEEVAGKLRRRINERIHKDPSK